MLPAAKAVEAMTDSGDERAGLHAQTEPTGGGDSDSDGDGNGNGWRRDGSARSPPGSHEQQDDDEEEECDDGEPSGLLDAFEDFQRRVRHVDGDG
ncbi:hypothetical protein ATCC90586_002988 [Pythium insidiosum]|nr:hypothetical protein ATCC90586_002988 [Pythium insidiosum]